MLTAMITFLNTSRGYGFLTTTLGEKYFFHVSNFEKDSQPVVGATVKFLVGPAIAIGKPPQAVLVRYPKTEEVRS